MKKKILLATLGVLGLGTTIAQASPADMTDKKWEITLAGIGSNDKDFNDGSGQLAVSVGYYFTPQWEVFGRQGLGYSDSERGSSSWTGNSQLGLNYHFDFGQDQRVIPYVGAAIGYLYGDETDDSIIGSPLAGVKWYVTDTAFVFANVSYDFLLKESFGDGQFDYAVGVGFRW